MTRSPQLPQPPYALLADVDGPISNPDARAIIDPRILPAIVRLLDNGIPLVFNTGRSAAFVENSLFMPILERNPGNLHLLHAVCEKGAVWLSLDDGGDVWHFIDSELEVPKDLCAEVRTLVEQKYRDTMFWDGTKETMISLERNLDIDNDRYHSAQMHCIKDLEKLINDMGYTVTRPGPHARNGDATLQIDPSIIAIDLESVNAGKDLGAQRAFELIKDSHPQQWRTIGDSIVDYAMADWLHAHGQKVVHVDVGLKRTKQERSYEVLIARHGVHDQAGAAYIEWMAGAVSGEAAKPEEGF